MRIKLDNCIIRSWREKDAQVITSHANNRKIWINLRDKFPYPYKVSDAESFIRMALEENPEVNFAIDVEDEAAGGIGVKLNNDVDRVSAEVGFWLGENCWGQGIATDVLIAFTDFAFKRFELTRVYGFIFEWNLACLRVFEKAGFTMEAILRKSVIKDGKIIDQYLYSKIE